MIVVARILVICTLFSVPALSEDGGSCASSNETDEKTAVASMSLLQLTASNGLNGLPSFAAFIAELGRSYQKGSDEYELRRKIYVERLQNIKRHNSNPERRWNAGVNHLTDRTDVELAQLRGLRVMQAGQRDATDSSQPALGEVNDFIAPDEKSWTHLHAISADTDQDACGSCWAVTTATTLRANAEAKGHSRTFSAQELVSCVPNPHHCGGDGGCKGSTVELAMNYVMESGLDDDAGTPYAAFDQPCKKGPSYWDEQKSSDSKLLENDGDSHSDELEKMIAVGFHGGKSPASPGPSLLNLRGWERLPENEYQPLIRAVAQTGPVAVSVGAREWHSYSHGIFDGCSRDSVIDHAVTLIGYGKDKTSKDKYWLIKNSWGPLWGEKGNVRLLRKEGNEHCGTDNQPKVGTGCDDAPPSVRVCGMCGILYDAVVPHFDEKI